MPRFARGISFAQLAFYLEQVQKRCHQDLHVLGEPHSDQTVMGTAYGAGFPKRTSPCALISPSRKENVAVHRYSLRSTETAVHNAPSCPT